LLPDAVETEFARMRVWTEGTHEDLPDGFVEGLTAVEYTRFVGWWARLCRLSVSPGAALGLARMGLEIDVRDVRSSIQAPTLALCRSGDENLPATRYMAERIRGARFVGLAGTAHIAAFGAQDPVLEEIEAFLTGTPGAGDPDRVLVTVIFTDIVGSTELASQLGDARWVQLLTRHDARVRAELERFRGREIDTAGDGFLATFDGPARAIRCAMAVRDAVRELGIEVRIGLHTGECELVENKVRGIAVHTGRGSQHLHRPERCSSRAPSGIS
jgi:hypothetical protein